MLIVVGSAALKYHNINIREPKDIDTWISSDEEVVAGDCVILPLEIMELVKTSNGFATPDSVYTIKCGHLGWNNHSWDKHKIDILSLKHSGCKLIPALYVALVEYWKMTLGSKEFLSLKQSKGEFFTDNVVYTVDHDRLHEMVAYPNQPIYSKCLKQDEDVLIDKVKFDLLPFDMQIRMFKEEIVVIAIERWLVPQMLKGFNNIGWFKAYSLSLKKTITSLTKGWATDFIVLNIEHFNKPDYTYFEYTLNNIKKELQLCQN